MKRKRVGFSFHEIMEGSVQREGERFDRPFRFEFHIRAPDVLGFLSSVVGEASGHVTIDGLAKNAPAEGTIELSPWRRGLMRYQFAFTGSDGKAYRFDGRKTITGLARLRGWTMLPGVVYGPSDEEYGRATLRFSFPRHLPGLLKSIRLQPAAS